MSSNNIVLTEFEDATHDCLRLMHTEICSFSQTISQNDPDGHSFMEVKQKLLILVLDALMTSCNGTPDYDLSLMPNWMRRVARSQGTNPVPPN